MFYIYENGVFFAETTDFDTACDCAMQYGGIVVDSLTGAVMLDCSND